MGTSWPLYFQSELFVRNPSHHVSLCTLWTKKDAIIQRIGEADFAACGNLYSIWGINFLLRNLLANPAIRYVVLCGADLSGSGQSLLGLWSSGIDHEYRIIGAIGAIDRQIPREAIDLLRDSIQIIDLRGVTAGPVILDALAGLEPRPPIFEPLVFPEASAKLSTLPSTRTGFLVEHELAARVWIDLLKLVQEFGELKPSEYGINQKELLNITAVVTGEDPEHPWLPEWLPTTSAALENYYPRVLNPSTRANGQGGQLSFPGFTPEAPELVDISYTYGGRLRNYRGVSHDQINAMVDKLRVTAHTRRAMAVTWDPFEDGYSEHPPCLVQLLAHIQKDQLFLTGSFRSHDIYGAWLENIFALRKLQKQIADALRIESGPLTVISHSAHIYEDKLVAVRDLLAERHPATVEWRDDPRGNFLISVGSDGIVCEHATTIAGKTGVVFEGRSARDIYLRVIAAKLLSLPEHAAYLGYELQKAELAAKFGLDYKQDRPFAKAPYSLSVAHG